MTTIDVAEAKLRLEELVAKTAAGKEFVLVQQGKPVARLNHTKRWKKWTPPPGEPGERIPGLHAGDILYIAGVERGHLSDHRFDTHKYANKKQKSHGHSPWL